MTRYAPLHLQRIFLVDGGHLVDRPMTGRAADALSYVNAVIEIRVFRQIVDAFPFDRLIVAETRPHRLQIWAVCPELTVAIHACLRRRHPRRRRCLNRLVTIPAIDAVIADMVFMAKLDRLLLFLIPPRQI